MAVTARYMYPHPARSAGLTVYGVQWGFSGGVVVAGVEVAFNAANWATYARVCPELGGAGASGIYVFAPDDDLGTGTFQVSLFNQVGGAPSVALDGYLGHMQFTLKNGAPLVPATGSVTTSEMNTNVNNVLARLPAALVGGRMDSSVGAMEADAITAINAATEQSISDLEALTARCLALLGDNSVMDDCEYDGTTGHLVAAVLYCYNSRANAVLHDKATGLLYRWSVEGTVAGTLLAEGKRLREQ